MREAERALMLVKKWLTSGNLAIWTVHVLEKSIISMFLSSLRDSQVGIYKVDLEVATNQVT